MKLLRLLPLLLGTTAMAQTDALVHTSAADLKASVAQLPELRATGARVSVVIGPGWFVVNGTPTELDALRALHGTEVLERGNGPAPRRASADLTERVAMAWLAMNPAALTPQQKESTHARHAADHTHASDHRLGGGLNRAPVPPAPSWDCEYEKNSETMTGLVWATNVVVESTGVEDMIDWVLTPNDEVVNVFLSILLSQGLLSNTAYAFGETLTFGNTDLYFEVDYEPKDRPFEEHGLWALDATRQMTNEPGLSNLSARLHLWNAQMRADNLADRAYTAFIGKGVTFSGSNVSGFGDYGGPACYMLGSFEGGTDNFSVYAHEVGHVFYGSDEYDSTLCSGLHNGVENGNPASAPCYGPGAPCLMRDRAEATYPGNITGWAMCDFTPSHFGWENLLSTPVLLTPADQSTVTVSPVQFTWDPLDVPFTDTGGHLRVWRANDPGEPLDDELIYCGSSHDPQAHVLNLVNGDYSWTVTVGGNGYSGVTSPVFTFHLEAPLNADFTQDLPAVCEGGSIRFTDLSTGAPNDWKWDFTGGDPVSYIGQYPPPVVYNTSGTYQVKLTVGDGQTQDPEERAYAVTVYDRVSLPYSQSFDALENIGWGVFTDHPDPIYGFNWQLSNTAACGDGALAATFDFGNDMNLRLTSPLLDLTNATLPFMRIRYSYLEGSAEENLVPELFNCDSSFAPPVGFFLQGENMNFNPGAYNDSQPWVPDDCDSWCTSLVDLSAGIGEYVHLYLTWEGLQGGQNFYIDQVDVFDAVRVPVKMFLEGPYLNNQSLMTDELRSPDRSTDPYSGGDYDLVGPWDNTWHQMHMPPFMLDVSNNDAFVDWVIVELRDDIDPTIVVSARPAILQRDGDVIDVDADGTEGVLFDVEPGRYYVAVRHRNHLGVMTASFLNVDNSMSTVDFTDSGTATYGTNAQWTAGDGKKALWSGNTYRDNIVRYTGSNNDRDPILIAVGSGTPNNVVAGYLPEDVNMNGEVKYTGTGNDRDLILQNVGSNTPNNTIIEQVP